MMKMRVVNMTMNKIMRGEKSNLCTILSLKRRSLQASPKQTVSPPLKRRKRRVVLQSPLISPC
jgi:hypothetical protein